MQIKTKKVSEWHSLFVAEEMREEKVPTQFAQEDTNKASFQRSCKILRKEDTNKACKGVAKNFVPFVRRLQHANKVEHVNMFVILSDTGRGMYTQTII